MAKSAALRNPAQDAEVDGGVQFVKYLWDERTAELERLTQADIDAIWKIVSRHSD